MDNKKRRAQTRPRVTPPKRRRGRSSALNMSVTICPSHAMALARSPRSNSRGAARRTPATVSHRRRGIPLHVRAAYGESKPDGTWVEKPQNAFGNLINLAKGQREIVQAGTPVLRQMAEEVPLDRIDSATIQELIQEMISIMRNRGVGLAAPQIGVPYRIFVMEDTEEGMSDVSKDDLVAQERAPFPAKVVINPTVTPMSNESCAFFEGCLSVQGYRGLVRRYLQVRVRGYGGDGKPVDFVAKGWQARIAQHEMDHLDGVLYVDRMDSRTFRRVDLLDQPLPGAHPELGPAPVVGKCADFAGPRAGGGAGGEGAMAVEDVEGFIGKKKSKPGKRKSR